MKEIHLNIAIVMFLTALHLAVNSNWIVCTAALRRNYWRQTEDLAREADAANKRDMKQLPRRLKNTYRFEKVPLSFDRAATIVSLQLSININLFKKDQNKTSIFEIKTEKTTGIQQIAAIERWRQPVQRTTVTNTAEGFVIAEAF